MYIVNVYYKEMSMCMYIVFICVMLLQWSLFLVFFSLSPFHHVTFSVSRSSKLSLGHLRPAAHHTSVRTNNCPQMITH